MQPPVHTDTDAVGAAEGGGDEASPSSRRFQQEFHVLACRVSASGEHVWSLVVENNGQVHTIPHNAVVDGEVCSSVFCLLFVPRDRGGGGLRS